MLATKLDIAMFAWEAMLGEPYRWGGDDPLAGLDCSGLALEGLKSCGIFPREGDSTAAKLATLFPAVTESKEGCLVFWGNPIYHVEIVWKIINGEVFTIGASGGGSKTQTLEDAIKQNAYVKIRPRRSGHVLTVDPFTGLRG